LTSAIVHKPPWVYLLDLERDFVPRALLRRYERIKQNAARMFLSFLITLIIRERRRIVKNKNGRKPRFYWTFLK